MNTGSPWHSARTGRYFLFGFLVIVILKLTFAAALDLYSDEIFYWQASAHPALAYSDLPFMAALLSGTGTFLFGNSALAVRALFLLLGSSIPFLVYWMARPILPRPQAWEASALSLCLPLAAFLGLLAVPDVPLLFFGLLLIGCFERATRPDAQPHYSLRFWLLSGLVAALGISTHYRFALYVFSALIALLVLRDLRVQWRRPGLWLALCLLAVGLYPAVAFNLTYDLSGLDYHLLDRHPWTFQPQGLLHPLKQAGLVTPLLYVALLATLATLLRKASQGDSRRGLFAAFALCNLGTYMVLAPWTDSTRTSIHWPLAGYLPLIVFLPETLRTWYVWVSTRRGSVFARSVIAATVGLGFCGSVVALLGVGSQSLQDQLQPILGRDVLSNKMAGWGELTGHVSDLLQRPMFDSGTTIVTDNYYTGAQLELALDGHRAVYNIDTDKAIRDGRAVQYELWKKNAAGLSRLTPGSVLFITEDSTLTVPDKIGTLLRACQHIGSLEFVEQLQLFEGEKAFSFYRGRTLTASENPTTAACPLPSLAWIDTPQAGEEVADTLTISGWVVNEGLGVESVDILLDGQVVTRANYGQPRPDVVEAMVAEDDPNAPNLGYSISLAPDASGSVELAIRVQGKSGEIQEFGHRSIVIRRP